MNFKQELIPLIIDGTKTQTRRLAYLDDTAVNGGCTWWLRDARPDCLTNIDYVMNTNGRVRFEVGVDYAVCPGQGFRTTRVAWLRTVDGVIGKQIKVDSGDFLQAQAKPLRIEVDKIAYQDVRDISYKDAVAVIWQ